MDENENISQIMNEDEKGTTKNIEPWSNIIKTDLINNIIIFLPFRDLLHLSMTQKSMLLLWTKDFYWKYNFGICKKHLKLNSDISQSPYQAISQNFEIVRNLYEKPCQKIPLPKKTVIINPHQLIPKTLLDNVTVIVQDYRNGALTTDELQEKCLQLIEDFQPRLSPFESYQIDQHTKEVLDGYFAEKDPKIREDMLLSFSESTRKILFYEVEKPLNKRVKFYCKDGINKFVLTEKIKKGEVKVSKQDLLEMEENFQKERVELKRVLLDYLQKRRYYMETRVQKREMENKDPVQNKIQRISI